MTMIGHEAAERTFLDAWNGGRMHHAWLLVGPKGLGKAAFADRAARFLLAQTAGAGEGADATSLDSDPDGQAHRLIAAGAHPEFKYLARGVNDKTGATARSISVDQIRAACAGLGTTKAISRYRAIIVDSADDLEAGGANALLKSLEEPPADTVFFLVSHASGRLLPTIRSRCRMLLFRELDDDVMASWLRSERPAASAAEIAAQLAIAAGSPGRAIVFHGSGLAQLWRDLDALIAQGDAHLTVASRLAQSLSLKASEDVYEAFLELAPSMLYRSAREAPDADPVAAVERWRSVGILAGSAIRSSADKAATVFEICRLMAGAARTPALSNKSG